jgi:hypothetical protein
MHLEWPSASSVARKSGFSSANRLAAQSPEFQNGSQSGVFSGKTPPAKSRTN